jgi:hypothetical protein
MLLLWKTCKSMAPLWLVIVKVWCWSCDLWHQIIWSCGICKAGSYYEVMWFTSYINLVPSFFLLIVLKKISFIHAVIKIVKWTYSFVLLLLIIIPSVSHSIILICYLLFWIDKKDVKLEILEKISVFYVIEPIQFTPFCLVRFMCLWE